MRQHFVPRCEVIDDVVCPLEIMTNQLGDVGAVFNDENAGHERILSRRRDRDTSGVRQRVAAVHEEQCAGDQDQ